MDFMLTDPEGGQHKLSGPEGSTPEQAQELVAQSLGAQRLAGGAVRGGPRPEPEVPHDYQSWGNLAEATAANYPHPPEDIRQVPQWMRENPEEVASIGMAGTTSPRNLAPRQIRSHLDELTEQHRAGQITDEQLAQSRQRLGMPAQSSLRSISAARSSDEQNALRSIQSSQQASDAAFDRAMGGSIGARGGRGLARTAAEMRATPPAETEQAMVRRAVAGPPRPRLVTQPRDIFAAAGYDDDAARQLYNKSIAPHFPDQKQFLDNYFAGAQLTDSTIRSKRPGGLLLDGSLFDPNQNLKFGKIQREIYPADGIAKHEFLQLFERARGGGFVKRLTKNQFDLYQKMGLEHVTLNAGLDVGGYAWAKFGWLPQEDWRNEALQFSINERVKDLERRGLIDSVHASDIQTLLKSKDPRTIWTIADNTTPFDPSMWNVKKKYGGEYKADPRTNTVGKALLAGQSWDGLFTFKNRAQMERFNHYVAQ
jgi:hypothetical protein